LVEWFAQDALRELMTANFGEAVKSPDFALPIDELVVPYCQ